MVSALCHAGPDAFSHSETVAEAHGGAVADTHNVLNLIERNSQAATSVSGREIRTYTIGVGNGCSHELIVKGAELGKGKHVFIGDKDADMQAKIEQEKKMKEEWAAARGQRP